MFQGGGYATQVTAYTKLRFIKRVTAEQQVITMPKLDGKNVFSSLHIDVARNSTDDFNLFHNKNKWQEIYKNPFNGPIVLGFQLVSLLEGTLREYRLSNQESALINEKGLQYSNYQFSFAKPVKPGEIIDIKINKSQFTDDPLNPILSNRISLKAGGKISAMGYKKESRVPLFLPNPNLFPLNKLVGLADRSFLIGTDFFIKRKFMNTSNAKNFLAASLVEQSEFFDEIEDKANFPEIFPCALISCALLEKAIKESLDFKRHPMVYCSHKISVDRGELVKLKSNDSLHILVKLTQQDDSESTPAMQQTYECYGVINHQHLLFRALISLVPLDV